MLPLRLTSSRRVRVAGAALVSIVMLAGCANDGDTGTAGGSGNDAAGEGATTSTVAKDPVLLEIEKRGAPKVEVPDQPATKLEVTDLVEGTGDEVGAGATITAHYTGVGQASGKQFDSSWDRGEPSAFSLNEVIPGWGQGLVGMKVGGRRRLVIPGDLAYGDMPPSPDIKAGETLVFDVDLVGIDEAGPKVDQKAQAAAEKRGEPTVTVPKELPVELMVTDDVVGTGDEVKAGDKVTVAYVGVGASTGKPFDSSWVRGAPVTFTLNEVIPGWGQGLVGMKVGGRRTLVIPPELAYGDTPPSDDIKPGETLVFVVDLVGIG